MLGTVLDEDKLLLVKLELDDVLVDNDDEELELELEDHELLELLLLLDDGGGALLEEDELLRGALLDELDELPPPMNCWTMASAGSGAVRMGDRLTRTLEKSRFIWNPTELSPIMGHCQAPGGQ